MSEQVVSVPLRWGSVELADSFRYLLSPQLLAVPLPGVPRIDCQNCRRVKEQTASFEVRCCDIVPVLPNFLVGEILSHNEHSVVNAWIEEHRGDPFAIWVPPGEAEKHLNARQDGHFGLPCPLLIPGQGRCSVYAQRPALCVSYHCYYPNMLWKEAWACLASTLDLLQDAGSRLLVTQFDFDLVRMATWWEDRETGVARDRPISGADASLRSCFDVWQGNRQTDAFYRSCWQDWQGQEAMFYRRCYDLLRDPSGSLLWDVRDLQRQQLWDRLAAEGCLTAAQESLLEEEYARRHALVLSPSPPPEEYRAQLREGAVSAEHNPFTIHQQESMLLWYLHKLQESSLQKWWQKLWGKEREVQDDRGIGITQRE